MAMDVGGSKGSLKADINVTPLVDVMLVLLIIMMLIAPMLQKGVNVQLPLAGNTIAKPDNQSRRSWRSIRPTSCGSTASRCRRMSSSTGSRSLIEDKTDRTVLIKGDKDASYAAIMQAMDYLHEAQIEDIGLITDPKTDPNKPPTAQGGN